MARQKRGRPFVSLPVGFRREHALSAAQFTHYWELCELALREWADRTGDRFQSRGVELARAIEISGHGGGVSNAVRAVKALPKHLVEIEPDSERRGVWWVTIHGFEELQFPSRGRGQGGLPSEADGDSAGGAERSGPAPAGGAERSGPAPATLGPAPAGGAGGRETEAATRLEVPSPPLPSSDTRPPPRDALSRARRKSGADLPVELPEDLAGFTRDSARWLTPNPRALVEAGDDAWLADEWRRFRDHHQRAGTRIRTVESLWKSWLKNPQTGERAHERRKAQTEAIAQGPLRMGPERVLRGGLAAPALELEVVDDAGSG